MVHLKGGKVSMGALKKEKGFTIIEVVLVLAIAGLIFLMVFIALPALQRNQRDSQRKNDMSRLQTALVNYSSSNRGNVPTTAAVWSTFVNTYVAINGDTFIDPSGAPSGSGAGAGAGQETYLLTQGPAAGSPPSTAFGPAVQNIIYYNNSATCSTSNSSDIVAAGTRKVAFRIALEGGGYYCVNN